MKRGLDVVAWDIGGAHLKLAHLAADGRLARVTQRPTPLWQGVQRLAEAIDGLRPELPATARHCITFTAELVDRWTDRETGLRALLPLIQGCLAGQWLRFYAGPAGLLDAAGVLAEPGAVMSANWHATAMVAASHVRAGVLLDIGSTSSDIIPFSEQQAQARGYSDQERLRHDELVYTGVIRSPVMSLCQRVPFAGAWQSLANECFATTADVYRVIGRLRESDDMQEAADGSEKSLVGSLRRLARMVGSDYYPGAPRGAPRWALQALAEYLSARQLHRLDQALSSILSRRAAGERHTLTGTGCGAFLAEQLAERHALRYRSFAELLQVPGQQHAEVNRAASACALAYLARTAQ